MRSAAELVRAVLEAGGELYLSKTGELLGRGIPSNLHGEVRRRRVEVVAELQVRRLRPITAEPAAADVPEPRFVCDPRSGQQMTVDEWFESVDLEGRRLN